jgi:hypothetical protein
MDRFFENYRALLNKVDGFCRDAEMHYGGALVCRKGCDGCCRHLSLFPVEAVAIRLALESADEAIAGTIRKNAMDRLGDGDETCPLIHEGSCLLYDVRPIICRTHGLPILAEIGGETVVDHCPLNFTDGTCVDRRHVIHLEHLNKTLSVVNRVFIDQISAEGGFPERLLLADALLMDLE